MTDLLAVYDAQLRGPAETPSAIAVTELGPLRLVTFPGGRGFVTSGPLREADDVAALVPAVLDHFRAAPEIRRVEWKTRGHDAAPGLHHALEVAGFHPGAVEAIMLGPIEGLAVDVDLPPGVALRRVTVEHDVRAMSAMAAQVFGDHDGDEAAEALLRRLGFDDGMELWVAEAHRAQSSGGGGREIVGAGRLEPVEGTEVAGIWGGAVAAGWRRRGIYRALTAARARSAMAAGKRYVHSDSTPASRPILERAGLQAVSTTTPYECARP